MNGIIIIDKPAGWTSHDVVAKLRGALREKRIGHGGTLDPMATGVLPVFVGRATRAAEYSENAQKEYIAGFRPGVITDTQDTTGNILEQRPVSFTEDELRSVLTHFTGAQQQVPPMYSAVKVGGKTLYSLARQGIEVERKPRNIEIFALEYLGVEDGAYMLRVVCSKGTYIRTLCHDIGAALGCGGCMCSLRRVRAGAYTLDDTLSLEDVVEAASKGEAEPMLRGVDTVFKHLPTITANAAQERKTRNGVAWRFDGQPGRYRVYGEGGGFLMLGEADGEYIKTVKSFFEVQ